jgi:hypothetical protein
MRIKAKDEGRKDECGRKGRLLPLPPSPFPPSAFLLIPVNASSP